MPLNDEEVSAANAEYAALPGTRPDFYSWRDRTGDPEKDRALFAEMIRRWKNDAKWFRVTDDEANGYLWFEGWKKRPRKEAPFNPPYTAEETKQSHLGKDGEIPEEIGG